MCEHSVTKVSGLNAKFESKQCLITILSASIRLLFAMNFNNQYQTALLEYYVEQIVDLLTAKKIFFLLSSIFDLVAVVVQFQFSSLKNCLKLWCRNLV